jgi:polysaccharide biosynthesis transport protein
VTEARDPLGEKPRSPDADTLLAAPEETPGESPLRKLHRVLRGRYPWAIGLALFLGLGGGVAGWKSTVPTYLSAGRIHVVPTVPTSQDPMGTDVKPMLLAFVEDQVVYLGCRKVVLRAMESQDWQKVGADIDLAEFEDRLEVHHSRGSYQVGVTFTHPSAGIATAAVKAIIGSYEDLAPELNGVIGKLSRDMLDREVGEFLARLKEIVNHVRLEANEYNGHEGLWTLHQDRRREVARLETRCGELDRQLRFLRWLQGPVASGKPLTPEEWESRDDVMKVLIRARRAAEKKVEALEKTHGIRSPVLLEAKADLEERKRDIGLHAAKLNEERAEGAKPDPEIVRLEKLMEIAIDQRESAKKAAGVVGEAFSAVQELLVEKGQINEKLARTRKALETVEADLQTKGRISIMSRGDFPAAPHKDKRKLSAVALGMAGAGLGILLVLLRGLLDRRLKDSIDLTARAKDHLLLGLLPRLLEDEPGERPAAEIAADGVRHVRSILEIGFQRDAGQILCITGPAPGSGKTMLAVSLGLSFSTTGKNVLLIDADLVGRGLTAETARLLRGRLDATADSDEEQIHEVPEHAASSLFSRLDGTGTGSGGRNADSLRNALRRAVVGIGVDGGSADKVLDALDRPEWEEALQVLTSESREADNGNGTTIGDDRPLGILDALEGSDTEECAVPTGLRNLRVLPAPASSAGQAGQLSLSALGRLLTEARSRFDVVIVDTGPVPGSTDASLVAALADTVLVAVSRGDERPHLRATLEHLGSIGARVAGMVFNRADFEDALRSGSSSYGVSSAKRTS